MGLSVPQAIDDIIRNADASAGPLDEEMIYSAQAKAAPDDQTSTPDQRRGIYAEMVAWRLMRAAEGEGEPWGIYWVPLASGTLADGKTPFYGPDIAGVDEEILTHWIMRADNANHPVVSSRYADLVWEIGRYLRRPVTSRPQCSAAQVSLAIPTRFAECAIDGYLSTVEQNLINDEYRAWMFLDRAIMLAISVKDSARQQRAKKVTFDYHASLAGTQSKFLWWRFHDLLAGREKALGLDEREKAVLIGSLETALAESSDITDQARFDPHKATDAADRLIPYFGDQKERQRVIKQASIAFERAAEKASGFVALGWLEDLIPRYRSVGLPDDAARVEQTIRLRADEALDSMKSITVPIEIPRAELEQWAEKLAGSSLEGALNAIAHSCLMREEGVRRGVYEMQAQAPLASRINLTIVSHDGFTEATIRSVDEDIEGRALKQAADRFTWEGPFLYAAFERTREKHGLNIEQLLTHIRSSPFFDPLRETLLRTGLIAWLEQDSIKAIHILVPQVEAACRDLLSSLGISVRRLNTKVGGTKAISFGEVLKEEIFQQGVMKDVGFHLQALYIDPRGLNLRNRLAHGLIHEGLLGMGMANWVVHSILLISALTLNQRVDPDTDASAKCNQ